MPAPPRHVVRAAAAGVRSQVLWQAWSRAFSFALKAAAVRAVGPTAFAYTKIRLGLLFSFITPVALSVRSVALRVPRDDTAATLVAAGFVATVVLGLGLGAAFAVADAPHAGVIALTVLRGIFAGAMERGRVFAARRERYPAVSRARALARIVNATVTTAAVVLLPRNSVGLYAVVLGDLAHAVALWVLCEAAAGPEAIPADVGRGCVEWEDVRLCGIAVWQRMFKTVLEKGEAIVLDFTCDDVVKGAYQLAGNVASMLARFFSEALEEQSFNVFSRFAPAFRMQQGECSGGQRKGKGVFVDEGDEAAGQREECLRFLRMAMKAALLVSFLIAFVGPHFSYPFLRLLYGTNWADDTHAPLFLSQYFVYLVFMGANGVSEALLMATAPSTKLQRHSVFTVTLSAVYMVVLYFAGRSYGASGIIVVNCAKMAARIAYSALYYSEITSSSSASLVLHALPHMGVVLILGASAWVCGFSESLAFGREPHADYFPFLLATARHAVSGAVSVIVFGMAVYVYERQLVHYVSVLRGRDKIGSASASVRPDVHQD